MPKTHKYLFKQVVSLDNLLAAYHRARKKKRYRPNVTHFDFRLVENLLKIQRRLVDGSYEFGPYRNFYIHEPKRRLISAAPFPARVVHHAVVGVLEPPFERKFIHDSYACRRGKGTHRAIRRCHRFLKTYPYYLKCDIVKFFPSVDHAILLQIVGRTVRDDRLMGLLGKVLDSGKDILKDEAPGHLFPGDDLLSLLRPLIQIF